MLQVLDVLTKVSYNVPLKNTVTFRCKDGVEVRLHPNTIELMVKKGQTFDGHTIKGTRTFKRIK